MVYDILHILNINDSEKGLLFQALYASFDATVTVTMALCIMDL